MSEDEWVSWKEACEQVTSAGFDTDALRDWAKCGLLTTRARFVIADGNAAQNSLLPTAVWKASETFEGHLDRDNGAIHVRMRESPSSNRRRELKAQGLEFKRDELDDLTSPPAASIPPPPESAAKPRRTRKRTEKEWQRKLRALLKGHAEGERRASDNDRTPPALGSDKELQRALGTDIAPSTFAHSRDRIYREEHERAFQVSPK